MIIVTQPVARMTPRRWLGRGLSLVELMVGIVVGLFVVAAATVLVTGQLFENKKLLLETQLQQDMRATMDIVARELRRSGAMLSPWEAVWAPDSPALKNDFTALSTNNDTVPVTSGTQSDLTFFYYRRPTEQGPWRFVLQGNVIKTQISISAPLQELTDPNVMLVETFTIEVRPGTSVRVPCPTLCAGGGVACWPEVTVREFDVVLVARAKADATVRRTLRSTVRARNDLVAFNVAGPPAQACPAS